MSSSSEKVRKAIFAKSNVAALVGTGKLTGIYESLAPADTALPYGIFFRQAGEPVMYAFNQTSVLEGDLWTFKVLAVDGGVKEPQEFAEDMLNTWETTLGTTLTLSGISVAWMARRNDIPPYQETRSNRTIYHRGFLMSIKTNA